MFSKPWGGKAEPSCLVKRPSAHVVLHKHLSYGRLRGTFGILVLISRYSKTQKGAISVQSSMTPTYFCNKLPTLSYHVQQDFHLRQSEFHEYDLHSWTKHHCRKGKWLFFQIMFPYLWICLAESNRFSRDSKANSRNLWMFSLLPLWLSWFP